MSPPGQRRWLVGFAVAIPLVYLVFFALTWNRVGPRDFDQFLVFHQLQYWNHALFGFSKQWSPLMCAGLSLAGEPQVPMLSLSMLLSYLVGPLYGIKIASLLYLAVGWYGAWLYAGLWQRERLTRAVAASLFIGNGFFFHRFAIGHVDFVPFLVLPLALWILHQALIWWKRGAWLQNVTLASLLIAVYGGAIAMVVDGSPVAVIHLLFWIGLYALVLSVHARSVLPLAILAGAMLLASVLDAGYLWPMLSAQSEFPRRTADVFTDPTGLIVHALLPLRGKITHGSGKGHEMSVFVGPVLAALLWHYRHALRESMPRAMRRPLLVVSVASIVLGMGSLAPLYVPAWLSPYDMLRPLPGFRSMGVTARYWGFLALPLSLLCAVALRRFAQQQPARTVAACLSIALALQIAVQADAFRAKWQRSRPYVAMNIEDYFHGRREHVSYVQTSEPHLQGEFITPRRGVSNCYDMDEFPHAPVRPGSQMITSQSRRASQRGADPAGAAIPLDLDAHPMAASFTSWNQLHLQYADLREQAAFGQTRTVVLNQAWNSHWRAEGCRVLRGGQNELAVECPEERFRGEGVTLLFHDEWSSIGATVSRRTWSLLMIFAAALLLVLASRSLRPGPERLAVPD